MIDRDFLNKKRIWIFTTEVVCPLRLAELVIYSYLAYQDQYDNFPALRSLCKATGVGFESCQRAISNLEAHGLVVHQEARPAPEGWFKKKRSDHIKPASHFSSHYTTWTYYVRARNAPLTHAAVALYSFLRHCHFTKYTPKEGWTKAYFATLLRCKRETISAALESLQVAQFLTYDDQLRITLYKLGDEQMKNFAEKTVKPRNEPKVSMSNSPAPRPAKSPSECFDDLLYWFRAYLSPTEADECARAVRDNTHWEEGADTFLSCVLSKLRAAESRRAECVRIAELAKSGGLYEYFSGEHG